MNTTRSWCAVVALACSATWLSVPAGAAVPVEGPSSGAVVANEDRMVAGSSVRVVEPTPGDLMAAGGQVDVSAAVSGDVMIAGGEVRLDAAVARTVYAAGGRLQVDGELGRHLRAAGGQVELGPRSSVTGNVTVVGGDVSLRGPIGGSLRVAGGRVLIDSAIAGNVIAAGGRIELGPNARIAGALRWRSARELERHASAQVGGPVERLELPFPGGDRHRPADRADHRDHAAWAWVAGAWWTAGMMLVAAMVLAAAPGVSARMARTLRERPGLCLLMGFVALVCIPVAIVILLLTVVGVPLALLAMLLYLLLIPLGYVATAIGLGAWGLGRWKSDMAGRIGWRIGAALLALVVLALLGQLPWAGALVALAALLAGLGAIVMQLVPARVSPA